MLPKQKLKNTGVRKKEENNDLMDAFEKTTGDEIFWKASLF